jgi:hypothetical protein
VLGAAPLGVTYARLGQPEKIAGIFADLKALPPDKRVPPQEIAILYVALRDFDQAFRYFEEALKERYPPLLMTQVDPFFGDLRAHPRYSSLASRFEPAR